MSVSWIVLIVIVGVIGLVLGIGFYDGKKPRTGIITFFATFVIVVLMILFGFWYYNNTAKGIRAMKDQQSNLNNGINREITIAAEDGREIYHYRGKCDIETNDKYIIFEDENGCRQMIYWGITDTIIISEIE